MFFNAVKGLFNLFFANLGIKVASLFVAIVIWAMVQGEETVEYNRRVKVNISVGRGFGVKGPTFRYVDATLRGPRFLLSEVESRSLEANLFIPSGQTGDIESPFDRSWISGLDPRIKLFVRDPYISVFVDELSQKTIPVRDSIRGTPKKGFFVEDVKLVPEEIKISGLKAELALVKEVFTKPIDITDLKKTTETFHVSLEIEEGLDVKTDPEQVKVTIKLGDLRINRDMSGLEVSVIGLKKGYRLLKKIVKISLQGTKDTLDAIDPKQIEVFVDLSEAKPGVFDYDVRAKIPPDTVLVGVEPSKIKVVIDTVPVSKE